MIFEESDDDRAKRIAQAVAFAGGYIPTNPEILRHLHREFVEKSLGPNATHAQMAYADGQRALVMALIRQYQLATQGSVDPVWQTIPPPNPAPQTPSSAQRQPRQRRQRRKAQ